MEYYERIRELREDNDLTQVFISSLLYVTQTTYSNYELGKTRIPVPCLLYLAKYYNVSMDYLCGISDVKNEYPKK